MTAPAGALEHPAWCDQLHMPEDADGHGAQIGADLELTSGLSYGVFVFQHGTEPAEVHLMRHTDEETSFTRLSILEASILRDLLGEGLGLLAREVGR